ncbi:lecithin retinol acyltransferase family protein [Ralstonia solanacearum]|nr:lecithin retinol acyltransferase family protein [Ralstonia solanacearum]MDB0544143.1 lecithin retinol acyltransferase family protein [Ralstonia solanacearum]MDB0559066.1 lecithin retinol acyltransferase family protein [Ralstonia solanacearum]
MISLLRQQHVWAHPTGTVVRVSHGLYDHLGLLGERMIGADRSVLAFSAQAGGFVEQPFSEFAGGRQVTVDGYLGNLRPEVVLQRARSMQGRAYSWLTFNCEHFVRYSHGAEIQSPQLRQWALLGSMAGLLAFTART